MVALEKKLADLDPVADAPPPVDAGEAAEINTLDAVRIPHISVHAFAATPEFAETWTRVAADRRMVATTTELVEGGFPAAIRRYATETTPNLIIIETEATPEILNFETDALAEVCDAETQVVIVGHCNDIGLYQRLLSLGVANYLVYPVAVPAMIQTIGDIYSEPGKEKVGRVIATIGANGGVGASSVAHNLSILLAQQADRDVMLVDMDLSFGTAGLNLDLETNQGLAEVIDQAERLDAGMLDRVLVKRGLHLNLLTTSGGLETDRQFDPFSVERLLEVATTHIPFTVLDMPHVWSDWSQRAIVTADDVLVVAEPELASLRNAANLLNRLRGLRPNDKAPALVLNRVGMPRRDEIPAGEIATVLKVEPAATLAFDPKLFSKAVAAGRMVTEVGARRPVARALASLAQTLQPKSRTAIGGRKRRALWWR